MKPPPAPALVVAGGLVWNLGRSIRNRRHPDESRPLVISRWACEHKGAAVTFAAGFSAWWIGHWVLYVIEEG